GRNCLCVQFFFSSRRRHTRWPRDWSSDVCSSDLTENAHGEPVHAHHHGRHARDTCTTALLQPQAPTLRGPVSEDMEADTAQRSRHYRLTVLRSCQQTAMSAAVSPGMAEYFASNPDLRYILFGGKGGLG